MKSSVSTLNPEISKVSCPWKEQDGVFHVSVRSNGVTGPFWVTRLQDQEYGVPPLAKNELRSQYFHPTRGVTTKLVIIPGSIFADDDRTTGKILLEGIVNRRLAHPHPETACLLREKLTDQDVASMGFSMIALMHKPIHEDDPKFFIVYSANLGRRLDTYDGRPTTSWHKKIGFAFAEP
jgi:hypothetical protein